MKLVIWDLDETLWEGTIYYNETVKLKPEAREVLKQIDKLGVMQYVCSHNKLEPVLEKIEEFGLTKYFKGIRAEVGREKPEIIQEILDEENIMPEETIFFDDTPLNRGSVKEIVGCHTDYEEDLYKVMKYFDTNRLKLMNQQRTRVTAEESFKGDFKEFLKTANMVVDIKVAGTDEIPRITNLANRTNELNAVRNRYNEGEIERFISDNNYIIYVVYLRDKFGDYGLIAEAIVERNENEWFIKDVCVSCRTMGRGIGTKLLKRIIDLAKASSIKKVTGYIIKNDSNFRMGPLFEKRGFKATKIENEIQWYELEIK